MASLTMPDLFCRKSAIVSSCGTWRYRLDRSWADGEPLVFIMLNPSTADADQDDPTIRKCAGFARHNGYQGIRVFNLFAFRATKPSLLGELGYSAERIGPENDYYLRSISPYNQVVFAWGSSVARFPWFKQRVREVTGLFHRREIWCVKQSGGNPWHPLYVPYGRLEPYLG